MTKNRAGMALVCAGALALTGCGSDGGGAGASSTGQEPGASKGVTGKVTVFAAASLKESFTALKKDFEKQHPGSEVVLSFGPSSGLATQITQGAPADVFASAAPKNMDQVTKAGAAASPKTFAANKMALVTPPKNPGKVSSLDDLAKSSVKTAVCQAQVPCGGVAAEVFKNADLKVKPASEEVDVKAVLTKVQLGEVDAGLVYVTDAKAAGSKVHTIDLKEDQNASTSYPIAALKEAPNSAGAKAWITLVQSAKGQDVLAKAGFAPPA